MPDIKLTNVTKRWGKFYAVDNLNLDIENNSFVTLLGPSRLWKNYDASYDCSLETRSGRITIGDKLVFDSEQGIMLPRKEKGWFWFQNYALWAEYDRI